MLGLPVLRRRPAGRRRGGCAGRHHHPQPHGRQLPDAGPLRQVLHARLPADGGDHPRHGGPPRHLQHGVQRQVLRGHGLSGPHQLQRQLQLRAGPVRHSPPPRLGSHQLLLQHQSGRLEPALLRGAVVPTRRLRPARGPDRPDLRFIGVSLRHRRRQRLAAHRHPRPRLPGNQHLQESDGLPHDHRCRPRADEGDRLPPPDLRPHPELHGVQRLLVGQQLHQPRPDRRVLGHPPEGRDHRPLTASQVRGDGPGRRAAAADVHDPQRTQVGRLPDRLHRHVLRHRRNDRRRDVVPTGSQQLPVDRRIGRQRTLAAQAGEGARPPRMGPRLHRPAPQRAGPGTAQPGDPLGGDLDPTRPGIGRGAGLVPPLDRPDRPCRRHSDHRVAHRLHGRAGLRGLLPPVEGAGGMGRHLGSRRTEGPHAARIRGPGHAARGGRTGLRRCRVLRPDEPLRGRHRLHGSTQDQGGRLHRSRCPGPGQGAPAARPGGPGPGRRRPGGHRRPGHDRPPTGRHDHQRGPVADPA